MGRDLFGTDGIRGVPGTHPLDDRTVYWTGHALGEYLRPGGADARVLLGMDTRESGAHLAGLIAAGLAAAGARAEFAGVITTPGVACLVREKGYAAGVVLSASHNPWTDNGIKLFAARGMKFPDAVEKHLEEKILQRAGRDGASGAPVPAADPRLDEEYLKFLRGCVIPGAKLAGMKIVLDCANGAASRLAPALFDSLGASVIAIHNQPDGRNINAGCGSTHPESLLRKVVESGAALGVAFDGDADRAMFATAAGQLVNGDGVLLAASRYLRANGKLNGGAIVGTTMANLGLERILAAEGLTLTRVPVGDRYVLEEMLRGGANLGGEQSGHVIFLDDAPTGDGLLTALKMACLVALEGPLENQVAGLKVYPQTIVNVRVASKPELMTLPVVAAAMREAELGLGAAGRIVLRYSGTEPLARVMVEAEREEDVKRWSESIAAAIQSAIGA